jgi:RimJ/RimL family protein N-acetyltransferase
MKAALGPIEKVDAHRMFTWRNDSEVTKYLAQTSMARSEVDLWYASLDNHRLAYSILAEEVVIGYVQLDIDPANQKCEVGVIIGEKEYWGKGIGKDVAQQITALAFENFGLHRVLAVASELNPASIKIFLSAGYKREGRLRDGYYRDGQFHDLILLSILEEEWRGSGLRAPE